MPFSVLYAFLLPSNSVSCDQKHLFLQPVLTQPETQKVPVAQKGCKLWQPGQLSMDAIQMFTAQPCFCLSSQQQ